MANEEAMQEAMLIMGDAWTGGAAKSSSFYEAPILDVGGATANGGDDDEEVRDCKCCGYDLIIIR